MKILFLLLSTIFLVNCTGEISEEEIPPVITYDKIVPDTDSTQGRLIFVPENRKVISATFIDNRDDQVTYLTRSMYEDEKADTIYLHYAYDSESSRDVYGKLPIRLVEKKNMGSIQIPENPFN